MRKPKRQFQTTTVRGLLKRLTDPVSDNILVGTAILAPTADGKFEVDARRGEYHEVKIFDSKSEAEEFLELAGFKDGYSMSGEIKNIIFRCV